MANTEPVSEEPISSDNPTATPWAEARRRLEAAETFWLATARPDGRPHLMPLMAVWLDGTLCFTSSEGSRKARNLVRNRQCVVAVGSLAPPALDLVIEGEAARVFDDTRLRMVADAYASKYGWQVTVRDGAFFGDGAPTAGPPPYSVFEVTPARVFGLPGIAGTGDEGEREGSFGATRWRF